ncbi:NAD+ synthase, partial [bacterium]|nr:NAD+ synthase [bacterium]
PVVGDIDGNASKIVDAMERARVVGADLVAVPELAISGYPPEDLLLKPHFVEDCRDALDHIASHSEGMAALVGFPHADGGRVHNAAALVHDRKVLDVYHKIELPNYGVFDEKRYFEPGTSPLVFEINGFRVFVSICEDVWVADGSVERYAAENRANIVLNLSASPFHAGKLNERRDVLARFARRTGTFVCYNNLVGGQDELVFDGGSVVIDPDGHVAWAASRFQEDLLVADIGCSETRNQHSPRHGNGRWVKKIAIRSKNSARRERVGLRRAAELSRLEEVHQALVLGARDYMRKNGFEKVVLGLSGGIDSALTAAIAVDALGPDNVVGVTMPSQYTSGETLSDAEVLAHNLGIRLITLPIRPMFQAYLDALEEPFGEGEPGIECENLQARVRGNILMALSNRFGWLVLTTGNKSEVAVGYCTLYGDTAGGFAVIKDVPKTLVYELAEHANVRAARALIPRSTIDRAPTAELRPNQTDQDSLPPYDVLDAILRAYVEEDRSAESICAGGYDRETVHRILRLVDRAEYKRRQAAPGVKITPKAFGRDRRLPITNRYDSGVR